MSQWTKEFPTEAGWYWMYGWPWGRPDDKPRLYAVEGRKISNGFMFHAMGGFIFKSDATGLWMKMDVPELPTIPTSEGDENELR